MILLARVWFLLGLLATEVSSLWRKATSASPGAKQDDIMKIIINANKNTPNLQQADIMNNQKNKTTIIHCGPPSVIDPPLWPVKNGKVTIPYSFSWTTQSDVELIVNKTVLYLNRILGPNFRLIPKTYEWSYVRFVNRDEGCFGKLGKCMLKWQPQEINLGEVCKLRGTVAHEILHALGFAHEQSRWDRDKFVTINEKSIKKGEEFNFQKLQKPADYPDEVRDHGPRAYDYHSLMHYPKDAFSFDGKNTITPRISGIKVGQRIGLTKHDVQELYLLYGFSIPATGALDCDFDRKKTWCQFDHSPSWRIEQGKSYNISNHLWEYEDHTYGYGKFALCDGKLSAGIPSELRSSVIHESAPPYCVKFAYAMPGINDHFEVGRLQVLIRYANKAEKILFDAVGDQGLDWKIAEVQMEAIAKKRQLVFRVVNPRTSKKPIGDICIDDIFFDEGLCPVAVSEEQMKAEKDFSDKKDQNIMIL